MVKRYDKCESKRKASDKLCLVVRVYDDIGRRVVSRMYLTHDEAQRRWIARRYGSKTALRYMAIFSPKDKRGVRWQTKRMALQADGRLA